MRDASSVSCRSRGVHTERGHRGPSRSAEHIAIVGMACRFPGAPGLASFWRLLETGGNSIAENTSGSGVGRVSEILAGGAVPSEACLFGAFVDDIELFGARFFRISPVDSGSLASPTKVIGADPTLPYSYLPTLDPSEVFAVGYDFLPDATHFLLLEQPEECVRVMREFLEPILPP